LTGAAGINVSARDPIIIFAERAQARAYLWATGELQFREAFELLLSGSTISFKPYNPRPRTPIFHPAMCWPESSRLRTWRAQQRRFRQDRAIASQPL
jgi:hypothetical protein